jgi:hydrogenase small subunit
MQFRSLTAASLSPAPSFAPRIAHAMETKPRLQVVWVNGLERTCCTESFIRSSNPLVRVVILSMLSLGNNNTIMPAAKH